MKNQVFSLGKTLTRSEQCKILGGTGESIWNCAPQYTQAQCNEYCNSVDIVIGSAIENEDWDSFHIALGALAEHCSFS